MVHRNCGPPGSHVRTLEDRDPNTSTADMNDGEETTSVRNGDFNQCVFIRGYRMRERLRLFTTTKKAAAGHPDLPDEPPQEYGPWSSSGLTDLMYGKRQLIVYSSMVNGLNHHHFITDDEGYACVGDQTEDARSNESATPYRDSPPVRHSISHSNLFPVLTAPIEYQFADPLEPLFDYIFEVRIVVSSYRVLLIKIVIAQ